MSLNLVFLELEIQMVAIGWEFHFVASNLFALFLNFLVVSFNLILFLNPGGLGFTSLGPTTIRWLFIK